MQKQKTRGPIVSSWPLDYSRGGQMFWLQKERPPISMWAAAAWHSHKSTEPCDVSNVSGVSVKAPYSESNQSKKQLLSLTQK